MAVMSGGSGDATSDEFHGAGLHPAPRFQKAPRLWTVARASEGGNPP